MGQLVYASGLASGGGGSAGGSGGGPNARYAYLVARLRNRQMTMEEATELFNLMQGMLQTSESARVALLRIPASPSSLAPAHPPPAARTPPAPGGSGDDFLLLGILAMGAGAGLLAAMTKRIQDVTTPPGSTPSAPTNPRTSPQKG
ncbi:MAG: hypothetical protein WB786_08990 [Thermoplasmata archaeon]